MMISSKNKGQAMVENILGLGLIIVLIFFIYELCLVSIQYYSLRNNIHAYAQCRRGYSVQYCQNDFSSKSSKLTQIDSHELIEHPEKKFIVVTWHGSLKSFGILLSNIFPKTEDHLIVSPY